MFPSGNLIKPFFKVNQHFLINQVKKIRTAYALISLYRDYVGPDSKSARHKNNKNIESVPSVELRGSDFPIALGGIRRHEFPQTRRPNLVYNLLSLLLLGVKT